MDEDGRKARIDVSLCTGCTLCEQICPVGAISGGTKNDTKKSDVTIEGGTKNDTAKEGAANE